MLRAAGYRIFLTPQGAFLRLEGSEERRNPDTASAVSHDEQIRDKEPLTDTVSLSFLAANSEPEAVGVDPLPGEVNYFRGSDARSWYTNIPTYARVKYPDIYPGIDLIYYSREGRLEFDFIVSPGSDPENIVLEFSSEGLELEPDGSLRVSAGGQFVSFLAPLAYQGPKEDMRPVVINYALKGDRQAHFQVGDYDIMKPLIIDPVLLYSTFLGGSGDEQVAGIGIDAEKNMYIAGTTNSVDLPGASTPAGNHDLFIAKLDPSGTNLIYSTYLGGQMNDILTGFVVNQAGESYFTGQTSSVDFPTTEGAFQQAYAGGWADAFVAKMDSSGSTLVYSTYLGSPGGELAQGITERNGHAYVAGSAYDPGFPTTPGAFQEAPAGANDGFVSKLTTSGDALVYSTFLGGEANDDAGPIAVDTLGFAYVTGGTQSRDFPTKLGVFQPSKGNGDSEDAFVAKLSPDGGSLIYGTFLGGSSAEGGFAIALDSAMNVYVTGLTYSSDFPTASGSANTKHSGSSDAFITKINPDASQLAYSTFLGGSQNDHGGDVEVDATGSAVVSGGTSSTDFPILNAFQPVSGGSQDAFVTRLSPDGTAVLQSSYLGGSDNEAAILALDDEANIYLAGSTFSSDFPLVDPYQDRIKGSWGDAFLTKIRGGVTTYFAQFGNGQGFRSETVLANPSSVLSVFGQLQFLDDDGLPLTVGIMTAGTGETSGASTNSTPDNASTVEFIVPPLGSTTVATDGGGDLAVGSALAISESSLGGVIRFQISGAGIAGVGQNLPSAAFIAPVRRRVGAINTGIALHNSERKPAIVHLSLRESGVEGAATTVETLLAGGHLARFIDELFPEVDTDDFEGTLVVQTEGGKVAGIALELGPAPGHFTTLPVTPLAGPEPPWPIIGLKGVEISSLALNSSESPHVLYAGTYAQGILRRVGGGVWESIYSDIDSTRIDALLIDPTDSKTVYAGTWGEAVIKSVDAGESWVPARSGIVDVNVTALVISSSDPGVLYAGTYEGGVFKTTDGGESWVERNNGLTNREVFVLSIDPLEPAVIYAGTNNGLFKSEDEGVTWRQIDGGSVLSVVISPSDPGTLYSSIAGYPHKSSDSGATWQVLQAPVPVFRLAVDPAVSTRIWCATEQGVFKSTDGGENWEATGLGHRPGYFHGDTLLVDPADSNTLYAGTKGGVFISTAEAGQHFFAQIGNGGGFSSDLVLTNPFSAADVSGEVEFFDHRGLPLPIGIAGGGSFHSLLRNQPTPQQSTSAMEFSIPPLSKITISTDGLGDVAVGSAVVTSYGHLGGVVRFGIPGIGIAGVGHSEPVDSFISPVRRRAEGINTGLALHNTGEQPVRLELRLRNELGQGVADGTAVVGNFPARGHLARFIDELFPGADTDQFVGTVTVEVEGGEVAATALELGGEAGQFTTMPVTPLE